VAGLGLPFWLKVSSRAATEVLAEDRISSEICDFWQDLAPCGRLD
jgi:hypothetical protein